MKDDTPSLADRMNAANERREAQRIAQEKKVLDRARNFPDHLIDDAVAQGDVQRLATMAEKGIIDPADAVLAAGVVEYDHPENRTRSVWLADRALTEARFPHRMNEIAAEARVERSLGKLANPEVHTRINEAVCDKLWDSVFSDWGDDLDAGGGIAPDIETSAPEPDRPVERIVRRLRM